MAGTRRERNSSRSRSGSANAAVLPEPAHWGHHRWLATGLNPTWIFAFTRQQLHSPATIVTKNLIDQIGRLEQDANLSARCHKCPAPEAPAARMRPVN